MYKEPIFLQPVFQERIWGGQKLRTEYGYNIPSEQTGEAWVISAHPNGPSVIQNGPLQGKTLKEAWEGHGELFQKREDNDEAYPLLVKILDANADLSVQVHPDDNFAREVEGQPYGKTECWYVLSAEEESEIVFGHHAETREQMEQMMDEGMWDEFLQRVKVKKGDFIYVPSGTLHAIGKGIVILETQQSSDITYRVYDYDRTDAQGNKRELHLDRAKQVTTVPHQPVNPTPEQALIDDITMTKLVEAQYFTVSHWQLKGRSMQKQDKDFLQVSVVEGDAEMMMNGKTYELNKGTHFILPSGVVEYELNGDAEFIVSWT
ncbi:mannose-6-phosphate isomerase [Salinibacillus kushneri]|uniref:Mannose-6-phosphate isomerase n=1 Tax=Salinibacillus kushneri TaxID=237682 RepID=A0A1I0ENJ9_9BACI|nr:mannose-6-phosphate isomerase, class I [Salinibacillus kushneri]SET46941.1 mannose-6-phosphate isomerase [Salinibacillus kushneri]